MNRGEVWWVNFDPSVGSEIRKRRPAVIVSNDAANLHLRRVTVIPLTSNTSRVYPSEAIVTVLETRGAIAKSKAMADQLQTVDKSRLVSSMGTVHPTDMYSIDHISVLTWACKPSYIHQRNFPWMSSRGMRPTYRLS